MSTAPARAPGAEPGAGPRALPWLLVLPAVTMATPLSPLAADPYPHLAGAGLAVLALVPLALLVLAQGWSTPRAAPFALAFAWGACVWLARGGTDPLEARRALALLALAPLALAAGSALDVRGRGTFALLLAVLSLAWTAWALARGVARGTLEGVLGDTGSLSQAALPGAAVAAAWVARARGVPRVLGAVTLGAFLAHVAAAPVLAGAHSLLAGLLLAAWRGGERGRPVLLALALAALLAPFAGLAARSAWSDDAVVIEGVREESARSLGGLGVRGLVWKAALGLVASDPLLGTGPGQFQAAFPPHRDAREIERSRHGPCAELHTEVEHAHDDWLQGFVELGLVGGALFALGLALGARDAFRALAHPERAPIALAALAVLVNAVVHAPLSGNPAAAPLAFALLGALAPAGARGRARAALWALPVLAVTPFAPALVRHGAALTAYTRSAARIEALAAGGPARGAGDARARALTDELEQARAAVERALAAAPHSAPARVLAARLAPPETEFGGWERVLEVRPHSVAAWERSAQLAVLAGRSDEARARYERALALSPTHPRLLLDAARLELAHGELAAGLVRLERLRANGCLASEAARALGTELVLVLGRPARGAQVLTGRELAELSPEELHARAAEQGADGAALEALAQLLWARAHAAAGAFGVALRNYRQAATRSHAARGTDAGPAALYALELAAAEARAGRDAEARARVTALVLTPAARAELPSWAVETLRELGVDEGVRAPMEAH